jgi:peptide/nickel transport system substrate-binding protein
MKHAWVLAASAGLLAFDATAAASDGKHKTLTIGVSQNYSNLLPPVESMVAKEYVLGFVHRRLTVYGYDWTLECQLCTEIPTVENGRVQAITLPDGRPARKVRFTLRPEVKWGDGTPLTTSDVLFSYEYAKHPMSAVYNGTLTGVDIIDMKALDERNFEITRTLNLCNPAQINDFRVLPAHIEEKKFRANPAEYHARSGYDAEPTNPGLWNGPYRIAKVERASMLVLERNPNWWGRSPYFDRIVIKAIENTAALESNLRSGDIDFIAAENGLTIDQSVAFQKRNKDSYDVGFKSLLMYEFLNVNQDDPWLKDLRLRQALLYAVDRAAISARIFEGQQTVADSTIHPLDSVHTDEGVTKYPYDKAKAIELLVAAGWSKVGPDGIRMNDKGERLSLELGTTAGNKVRELVQQVMQRMWKDVGIETRLKVLPPRVVFGEVLRKRQFPHLYMTAFSTSPGALPEATLYSRGIPSEANGWAGQNYSGARIPAIDRAIESAQVHCSAEDQKKAWGDIQRATSAELPILPLYFRVNTDVTPKWLHGVRQTGHQFSSTMWVETWTVD